MINVNKITNLIAHANNTDTTYISFRDLNGWLIELKEIKGEWHVINLTTGVVENNL